MNELHQVSVEVIASIDDVAGDAWDSCANPDARSYNPFVSHAFLKALEDSVSVGEAAGWIAQHLILHDANGKVAACMPLYVKTHSRGEFVFDHAFADAFMRAGGRYYPKLQCAVPFTPVPGPRLLVPPGENHDKHERLLAAAAISLAQQLHLSSVHITFLDHGAWSRLGQSGYLQRTDQQFHWENKGYSSFDDFLASLSSRKRKSIKKERRDALSGGLKVEWLRGEDIKTRHWDQFFEFYLDTHGRKWGEPYLNRDFFDILHQTMGDECLLMLTSDADGYQAGALHILGSDTLYGRYWGALSHRDFLHFEVCYYQAIEYAITHKLQRVEAGAQGTHKLTRGYMPETTYSLHWFANESLSSAVADYLDQERHHVERQGNRLRELSPFRKCD